MDDSDNTQIPRDKKPIGRAPNYTTSYYLVMAKEVVENGLSYRKAAEKYKCSHGTVSHWTKLFRAGKLEKRVEKDFHAKGKADIRVNRLEQYVKELKTEIAELYLENQILKKAQSHFRQLKNANTSVITSENLAQYLEGVE